MYYAQLLTRCLFNFFVNNLICNYIIGYNIIMNHAIMTYTNSFLLFALYYIVIC